MFIVHSKPKSKMKNQPHAEDLVFNSKPIAESGQAFTLEPLISGMHRRREKGKGACPKYCAVYKCTVYSVRCTRSVLHSTNVQFTAAVQRIQS